VHNNSSIHLAFDVFGSYWRLQFARLPKIVYSASILATTLCHYLWPSAPTKGTKIAKIMVELKALKTGERWKRAKESGP